MRSKRALLIAGTTASGKSSLALKIADQCNGVIINTDSMQVYADLRILSARPSLDEEAQAPHHLYGHVDGAINYSIGKWLEDVRALLPQIWNQGQLPIFVGGTGLYFLGLTQGLSKVPTIDANTREGVREMMRNHGVDYVYEQLQQHDPDIAAKLKRNDQLRICRALEVILGTGKSLLHWQNQKGEPILEPSDFHFHVVEKPREDIYQAINTRFDEMIETGALEEVRALMARNLSTELPIMRAHGVPWLIKAMRGEMEMKAAIDKSKADTRHYAKRQLTWWRNQAL